MLTSRHVSPSRNYWGQLFLEGALETVALGTAVWSSQTESALQCPHAKRVDCRWSFYMKKWKNELKNIIIVWYSEI